MDPSCLGSGMLNNVHSKQAETVANNDPESLKNYVENSFNSLDFSAQKRVQNLANFQKKMLCFCIEHFPKLEYLVYSTCSIYRQEDEDVVIHILTSFPNVELVDIFGERWPKRGINFTADPSLNCLTRCIRETPTEGTNDGFFTALFKLNSRG